MVDTPPGTSDEHLSAVQYLAEANVDGAVIVTTPQVHDLLGTALSGCISFLLPRLPKLLRPFEQHWLGSLSNLGNSEKNTALGTYVHMNLIALILGYHHMYNKRT